MFIGFSRCFVPTGAQSFMKEYFVTDWQTGSIQRVRYEGESLAVFIRNVGIEFKMHNCQRLYALYPKKLHAQRQLIDTTAKLREVLTYINNNCDDSEAIMSLYIYPLNESPQGDPCPMNADATSPILNVDKMESLSNSNITTEIYFENLHELETIGKHYGLCSETLSLHGCHIVDASAISNHYYPYSNCLRWKFDRFVEKRDREVTRDGLVARVANGLASIFVTPPSKSKKKCL